MQAAAGFAHHAWLLFEPFANDEVDHARAALHGDQPPSHVGPDELDRMARVLRIRIHEAHHQRILTTTPYGALLTKLRSIKAGTGAAVIDEFLERGAPLTPLPLLVRSNLADRDRPFGQFEALGMSDGAKHDLVSWNAADELITGLTRANLPFAHVVLQWSILRPHLRAMRLASDPRDVPALASAEFDEASVEGPTTRDVVESAVRALDVELVDQTISNLEARRRILEDAQYHPVPHGIAVADRLGVRPDHPIVHVLHDIVFTACSDPELWTGVDDVSWRTFHPPLVHAQIAARLRKHPIPDRMSATDADDLVATVVDPALHRHLARVRAGCARMPAVRDDLDARRQLSERGSPTWRHGPDRFAALTLRAALRLRADLPTAFTASPAQLPDSVRTVLHELTTPPIRVTPYGIETTEVVSPDPRGHARLLAGSIARYAVWTAARTGTLADMKGVVGAVRQTYGDTAQSLVLEPAVEQLATYPSLAEHVARAVRRPG